MAEALISARFAKNSMLYLYYGKNKLLAKEKIREKLKTLNGESFYYQAEDKDVVDFFNNNALQGDIFSSKKAVVVDGLFSDNELAKLVEEKIDKLISSDSYFFFLSDEKGIKGEKLFKKLAKSNLVEEFKDFSPGETANWLKNKSRKENLNITSEAINLLVEFTGNDLWRISNELEKLANYTNGKIKEDDVKKMVFSSSSPGIFGVIDVFLEKDKRKAFSLIKKYLLAGDDSFRLISMIAYQYRTLLLVSLLRLKGESPFEISKDIGINYYIAKKLSAAKISLPKIKESYLKILEADLAIKKGVVPFQTGIFSLVADLVS